MTDEEFWQALRDMPEPRPVDYRIYYNEQGELLFYSMEDVPGTYLTIDAGTPCDPDDVSIVVPETHEHQKWSKQRHGLKPN